MARCRSDAGLDLARVLEPDLADADGFGHCREVRVLELGAKWKKAGGFLLELDEPEGALLKTTTFTGRPSCTKLRKSPISIVNPPSPDSEITWRSRNAATRLSRAKS